MSNNLFSTQQLETMTKMNSSVISLEDRFSLYEKYSEFTLEYVMYENEAIPILVHIYPYEEQFIVESYQFNAKQVYDKNENLISNTLLNYCIGMENVVWNPFPTDNSEAFTLRKFINTIKDFMDEKIMGYIFPGLNIRQVREMCDATKEKNVFGEAYIEIGFTRAVIDANDKDERLSIVSSDVPNVSVIANDPVTEEMNVRYDIIGSKFKHGDKIVDYKDCASLVDYPIRFNCEQSTVNFKYDSNAKTVALENTPLTIVNKLSYINFIKAILQIVKVITIHKIRDKQEDFEVFSNLVFDRVENYKMQTQNTTGRSSDDITGIMNRPLRFVNRIEIRDELTPIERLKTNICVTSDPHTIYCWVGDIDHGKWCSYNSAERSFDDTVF